VRTRLYAWSPEGELRLIPIERAKDASESGWKVETPEQSIQRIYKEKRKEKYGGISGAWQAGMLGLSRGWTAGLMDWALSKDPIVKESGFMQKAKELKEEWPLLSAGTEIGAALTGPQARIAGALGGATTSAGARVLGQAASTSLARQMVAQGLARGAGGAVEGAFMTTGHLISETALGNPVDISQKLMLGAGIGGGLGAAFGVGGALAGAQRASRRAIQRGLAAQAPAAEAAAPAGFGGLVRDWFGRQSRAYALRASGATPGKIGDIIEKGTADDVGNMLLQPTKYFGGKKVLPDWGSLRKGISNIQQAQKNAGAEIGESLKVFDDLAAGNPAALPNFERMAQRIEQELAAPLRGVPLRGKDYKKLMEAAKDWRALADRGAGFKEAWRIKRVSRMGINYDKIARAQDMKRALAIVNDEMRTAARELSESAGQPGLWAKYDEANRAWGLLEESRKLFGVGIKRFGGNRTISLTDHITGGIAGVSGAVALGPAGLLLGAGTAVLNKLARERGPAVIARALQGVSGMGAIQRTAVKSDGIVKEAVKKAITGVGRMPKAPSPVGAAAILGAYTFGGTKDSTKGLKGFRARLSELEEIMSMPEGWMDTVQAGLERLSGVAPETAAALAAKQMEIVKFLFAKAPKPPKDTAHTLQPHLVDWQPTKMQVDTWSRYVRAAMDPQSVLTDLARWAVTPEAIQTLRTLYPTIFSQASEEIAEQAAEMTKELPYDKRIKLSLWFGAPADPTLAGEAIRFFQQTHAQPASDQSKGQAPGGLRFQGLDEITFGKNATTPGMGGKTQ
jgi:hypothetical protein